MSFKVLEHTADIGIQAQGANFKGALAEAALGMFNLITDLDKVEERESLDLEVSSSDKEGLVINFLNELIYLFEVRHWLLKRCEVISLDGNWLKARLYGEKIDFKRHPMNLGIKAATYHMVEIKEGDGCQIQVIFDV